MELDPPVVMEGKKVFPAAVADAEARVKALMENLGSAAGTQNIDRILRLPAQPTCPTRKSLRTVARRVQQS